MSDHPFASPPQTPPAASEGSNTVVIVAIVLGACLMLALVCGGVLLALLLPAVSAARNAARTMSATNHMKQVGLAIHNYHDTYQQLPPAFVTDSDGNPLGSWRVALLPFLEAQPTWDQWQHDEPWNSEANAALSVPMPVPYSSPWSDDPMTDQTHVFAVRHPLGAMSGEPKVTFGSLTDGMANTIVAVWLPGQTTSWASPQDVTLDELQAAFASLTPPDSILVLFADASVIRISTPLDPATVEAMVTRNAGDTVDQDFDSF